MNKYWSLLFAIVIFLCTGLFVIAPAAGWWLPKNVSKVGEDVDFLFYLILGITTFFFILTEALLVYAVWTFAHTEGRKAAFVHGNHRLEVMWTAVPAVILVLIAVLQISTWEDIKYHSRMPLQAPHIFRAQQMEVTARQWEWRVRYPNPKTIEAWTAEAAKPENEQDKGRGREAVTWGSGPQVDDIHAVNEIHVWSKQKTDKEDQKVLVHLKTRDVIHSFFLPMLRLKQDALPGKTIPVWFMADDYNTRPETVKVKVGDTLVEEVRWVDGYNPKTRSAKPDPEYVWDLACAEFCGTRHSMMRGKLYVHKDQKDFLDWLKAAEKAQNARKPEGK